jgi:hypothetical protein
VIVDHAGGWGRSWRSIVRPVEATLGRNWHPTAGEGAQRQQNIVSARQNNFIEFGDILKGLSHEIDFKTFDQNLKNLA